MRPLFVLIVLTLIVTAAWVVWDDPTSSPRTTSSIEGRDPECAAPDSVNLDALRETSASEASIWKDPIEAFDESASSNSPSAIEEQQGESRNARAFDDSMTTPPRRFIDQGAEQVLADPLVNPLGLGLSEDDLKRLDELRKDLSSNLETIHQEHAMACLLEGSQLIEKGQCEIYTRYQAVPRNHEYEYLAHRGDGKDRELVARVDPTRADASPIVLDTFADWKSAEYEAERQLARFIDQHGR